MGHKGTLSPDTIIVCDFSTALSSLGRLARQKWKKKVQSSSAQQIKKN
jgi:hypothetical protein